MSKTTVCLSTMVKIYAGAGKALSRHKCRTTSIIKQCCQLKPFVRCNKQRTRSDGVIPLTGEMSRSDKRVAVRLQSRSLHFSSKRQFYIVGSGAPAAPCPLRSATDKSHRKTPKQKSLRRSGSDRGGVSNINCLLMIAFRALRHTQPNIFANASRR